MRKALRIVQKSKANLRRAFPHCRSTGVMKGCRGSCKWMATDQEASRAHRPSKKAFSESIPQPYFAFFQLFAVLLTETNGKADKRGLHWYPSIRLWAQTCILSQNSPLYLPMVMYRTAPPQKKTPHFIYIYTHTHTHTHTYIY